MKEEYIEEEEEKRKTHKEEHLMIKNDRKYIEDGI